MSRTADKAGNDVLVFVHQNVLLHSLTAMIRAAAQLRVGVLGLRGAVAVRGDGRIAGRRGEMGRTGGSARPAARRRGQCRRADLHGAPPRGAPPPPIFSFKVSITRPLRDFRAVAAAG
jgi:hypothetical protein